MEKKSKFEEFWKRVMWNNSLFFSLFCSMNPFYGCQHNKTASTSKEETTQSEILSHFTQMGTYYVGHKQIEHQYIAMENQPPRNIIIDIWYPTIDDSGDIASYLYGTDELVFENATLADPIHENGYPVHLHSHGYQGWGATSAFLMRYFASHGWIAIAPNHTNNLLADHQDPLPTEHFIHRPMDLTQSLHVLIDDDMFQSKMIQIDNVLMSGHSFGASYSAWSIAGASYDQIEESCSTGEGLEQGFCTEQEQAILSSNTLHDDRIAAIIPLAGTIRKSFFGETGYRNVQIPILFMSGTEDNHQAAQEHFDEIVDMDFTWLSLEGGCHQSFALGQCPTLDVSIGFEIIQSYSLAFARKHILKIEDDEINAWLSGDTQKFEETILQYKTSTTSN